ncbi:MAG: type II secretion system protein N [Halioglobus sp.]
MSRTRLGIAVSILFLLILIANAPARLIGHFVSSDLLVLQGFSGTVWRGKAARGSVAVGHGYLHLGAVRWKLSAASLLGLSPKISLRSRWGAQKVSGKIIYRDEQSFDFEDLEARLSAQVLSQFSPLAVKGNFVIQLSALELRDGLPTSGEGRIVWERAAWASGQGPVPLGSYAADFFQSEDQPLRGEVVTIAGPVDASGRFELAGRNYSIDVLVSSESGLDPQLQQSLSLLAQPVDKGYRIQLTSEF